MADAIQQFSVWVIPLILAITLHEAAHGFVALRLGDDTALRAGRISANPLHHVDPFGTLLLPAMLLLSGTHFLFGWAKPVPVNFGRLKPPRLGMVLVALAGPGTNLALALLSALAMHGIALLPVMFREWTGLNLYNSVSINLVLAVFNMIPVPPLDGGRVLVGLLPRRLAWQVEKAERPMVIGLLLCLVVLPLLGINLFQWVIGPPVEYLAEAVFQVTGID
jgi:Zn-dependent protease